MKKTLLSLAVVVVLLALIACSADVEDRGANVLHLSLDDTSARALVATTTPIGEVTYKATLTQTDGSKYIKYDGTTQTSGEEFVIKSSSTPIELSYGKWTLVVKGYKGTDVVYTSTPEGPNPTDITFTMNSAKIGSLTTTGVGASVDTVTNTLKVLVRNIKEGTVSVTKVADSAITGVEGSNHELKWEVSTDYQNFNPWTESTTFSAGTTYWVRCRAVDKTDSTLVYATATTKAFSLYFGESANITGSLDPNTGAFNLEIGIAVQSISLSPVSKTLAVVPAAAKSDNWDTLGLAAPVVKYAVKGTTDYSETKPTAAGSYTAVMTVGGKSVTMDFEI